ncbi:hypothetical protein DFH27DRAFT_553047 [Peziza echinospora]|nr:hypothetical protein DFH27DRAFT_553047 [Peziza echinospora]
MHFQPIFGALLASLLVPLVSAHPASTSNVVCINNSNVEICGISYDALCAFPLYHNGAPECKPDFTARMKKRHGTKVCHKKNQGDHGHGNPTTRSTSTKTTSTSITAVPSTTSSTTTSTTTTTSESTTSTTTTTSEMPPTVTCNADGSQCNLIDPGACCGQACMNAQPYPTCFSFF